MVSLTLRSVLFLFSIFYFSIAVVQAQPIGWEVTGYPGTSPISTAVSQVLQDPIGRTMGVVSTGPRLTITTDNGRHWSFIDLPFTDITGFEYKNGFYYISTASSGLHRSQLLTDWQPVTLPNNEQSIRSLDGNRGFFEIVTQSSRRIYSTDGETYHLIPDSLGVAGRSAMAFNGPNEILFVSEGGYWKSVTGSNAWQRIGDGRRVSGLTVAGDSLYLATYWLNDQPQILRAKLGGPLDFDTIIIEGNFAIQMMHTIEDTILLVLRNGELHHSFNRYHLSPPLERPGINYKDFSISPLGGYIGSDLNGVFVSKDYSVSWSKISKRLEANMATELLSIEENVLYAATNQGYIMRSDDKGANWILKNDLVDTITLLAYTQPNNLWVGQKGKLLVSTDGGESFVGFDGFSARTPSSMIFGRNGKIFLGTDSGMFFSSDQGNTWFMPQSFLMNIISGQNRLPAVLSLALDSANRLYVGTTQGVVLTLNEGDKYETGWLSKIPIYAIQATPAGYVYVGTHSVRSDDTARENFYTAYNPIESFWYTPNQEINEWEMNVLNLNSKQQLVAGMLFTWKGGVEWETSEIEGVQAPVAVLAQAIDKNDVVYISYLDKVYRSVAPKVSSVSARAKGEDIAFFPNPASSVLNCESPEGGTVRLLNMLGEEVLTSRVGQSDRIDVSMLPVGVYFCQFTSTHGVISRPVVISR